LEGSGITGFEIDNFQFGPGPNSAQAFYVEDDPWQQDHLHWDGDGNGRVKPLDALTGINLINEFGIRGLPFPAPSPPTVFPTDRGTTSTAPSTSC